MLAPWAIEEMKTAELNDKRLNDRLTKLASALGAMPRASIPAACGGHTEMTAAYRFFKNPKVTVDKILRSHIDQSLLRIALQKVVVLVQDTTEIDVTRPEQQMVGTGPMDGSDRRGFFVHLLHAFSPDGTPLGTVGHELWAREEDVRALTAEEKREERKAAPIEDKESYRWVKSLQQSREIAQSFPEVQCLCVADSEADIYEVFAEPRGATPVHWLVRACQDRSATPASGTISAENSQLLRGIVSANPVLFTQPVSIRGRKAKTSCETRGRRQPRTSRDAVMEVRSATVTLRPPYRPDGKLAPVTVNVVQVREVNVPEGDEPVEWLLVTTLPIDTEEQIRLVVQYYTVRWGIEVFFRTLKSGCRVEGRLFEHKDRFLPCLALYLIVTWRILYVCHMGRSCPEMDCEAIFEPSEWKSVWTVVKGTPLPKKNPHLQELIKLIAQLGGYVNLPNRQDPPGAQTIWLGMQRMHDLALAWDAFGPGATKSTKNRVVLV